MTQEPLAPLSRPTLLVLAAGMGSRYGSLKQIDPVGPSGEMILDYGVYDALRAGFERVVFIIRQDFESVFRAEVSAKYAGHITVDYAYQALDALPEGYSPPLGREKPWGTGHAVWCAREQLREPFAVINADDFYGADSFAQLARFLTSQDKACMVGFRLNKTLSENGSVSRGICTVDELGRLQSIEEHTAIHPEDVGNYTRARYTGDEVASMNCWGFTPRILTGLDAQLREFLDERGSELKSEFYLPTAVSSLISREEAEVTLLRTTSEWFGVTYREDRPRVEARIAALVTAGCYPKKLF